MSANLVESDPQSLAEFTDFTGYVWNPYMRAYVPVAGLPVDTAALRATLADIREAAAFELEQLAQSVISGELTNMAEFAVAFKDQIKPVFVATHVLTKGGVEQMKPRDWGKLGSALREQYKYASQFVRDIEQEKTAMPIDQRIEMYMNSAWGAAGEFENTVRDREMYLGSLERRVLGDSAESCEDCIELAARGWQPPGLMPDIGDTECGPGCNCTYEFENTELDNLARSFGGANAKFPASEHPQINRQGTPTTPRPKPKQIDLFPDLIDNKSMKGGSGSGNFGHRGRPGEVGGSGPGGQDAVSLGLIHGVAPTAVIRYMANMYYTKGDVKKVLLHYGIDINPGTLNKQYRDGQMLKQIPELKEDFKNEIFAIVKDSPDLPKPPPVPVVPRAPSEPRPPVPPGLITEPAMMKFGEYIAFSGNPPPGSRLTLAEHTAKAVKASDKLNRVLDKGIKAYLRENKNSEEAQRIAKLYKESAQYSFSHMTDQARINAARSLRRFEFLNSFQDVRKAGNYSEQANVAAYFNAFNKRITSDGQSFGEFGGYPHQLDKGKFYTIAHHFTHELGHAADSRGSVRNYISYGQTWRSIWRSEIDTATNPLSEYARRDATEGFAEFFRAATYLRSPTLKVRFPKAFKFFVKKGLINDVSLTDPSKWTR